MNLFIIQIKYLYFSLKFKVIRLIIFFYYIICLFIILYWLILFNLENINNSFKIFLKYVKNFFELKNSFLFF